MAGERKPRGGHTPSFYEAAWALVRKVPHGRVVSYGQVATWLGSPRAARAVGYAMFNVAEPQRVPWQRVINSRGEISIGGLLHRPELQRKLLEAEGVRFDRAGRVDLGVFGWEPGARDLKRVARGEPAGGRPRSRRKRGRRG